MEIKEFKNKEKKEKQNLKTYWIVEVDKTKCSMCEVCVDHCPSNAISMIKDDEEWELVFNVYYCNNCNGKPYCQEKCPEEAIYILEKKDARKQPAILSLMKEEIVRCHDCGTSFIPAKKIKTIQNKPELVEKEVQKLCPDCRRKRLINNLLR
ncbi:MAG: 4Fe-4S dicluster domain-containing protein [Acidobacteriota bacterium]